MEIDVIREIGMVMFCELDVGEVFYFNGVYYLRIEDVVDSNNDLIVNAVLLDNGDTDRFEGHEKVREIENARVVID